MKPALSFDSSSAHTRNLLTKKDRAEYVEGAVSTLQSLMQRIQVDAIAVKGTSGLVIGSIVADKLDIPLIVVRLPGQSIHSAHLTESPFAVGEKFNYVIVDDSVASGTTISTIKKQVGEIGGQWVGTYLYFDRNLTTKETNYRDYDGGFTYQDLPAVYQMSPYGVMRTDGEGTLRVAGNGKGLALQEESDLIQGSWEPK